MASWCGDVLLTRVCLVMLKNPSYAGVYVLWSLPYYQKISYEPAISEKMRASPCPIGASNATSITTVHQLDEFLNASRLGKTARMGEATSLSGRGSAKALLFFFLGLQGLLLCGNCCQQRHHRPLPVNGGIYPTTFSTTTSRRTATRMA